MDYEVHKGETKVRPTTLVFDKGRDVLKVLNKSDDERSRRKGPESRSVMIQFPESPEGRLKNSGHRSS